jgi:hypothetical protein
LVLPNAIRKAPRPQRVTHLADVVRVIGCVTTGGRVWLRADATAQESVIFRTEQCRP